MPYIEHHHGAYIVHGRWHGREGTLVQVDYDYPRLAEDFGWSLRRVQKDASGKVMHMKRTPPRGHGCDHAYTDGTVKCPTCGILPGDFIAAAGEFIDGIAQ